MNDVAQELESILTLAGRLGGIQEGAAAHRPGTGKWSNKEILGHLVDSAANNHQRFVRMQLQSRLELPGYDQDGWIRVERYQDRPWAEIIELWRVCNRHLAHIIRHVDPKSLKNTWRAPDGQIVDLEFIIRDYLVHTRHHLDQILGI